MDIIVSTHKNPYHKIWNKRGSKYLTNEEYAFLIEEVKPFCLISCEKNEFVGNTIPIICSEDLDVIICTESEEDYKYSENNSQNNSTYNPLNSTYNYLINTKVNIPFDSLCN